MTKVVEDRDSIKFENCQISPQAVDSNIQSSDLDSSQRKYRSLNRKDEIELISNLQGLYRECLEEIRNAPNCLEIIPLLSEILKENRMFSFGLLMENTEISSTQLENKFLKLVSDAENSTRGIQQILAEEHRCVESGWSQACADRSTAAFDQFKFTTAVVDYLAPLYIKTFSGQLNRNPNLDSDIEDSVARIDGLFARIANLRDTLFNSQEDLVRVIVKSRVSKYGQGSPGLMHDFMQEARVSLYVAMHRFDTSRGLRFNTYATNWIKAAVFNEIYENLTTVKIPRYVVKALNREYKFGGALKNPDGTYSNDVTPELRSSMDAARRVMTLIPLTDTSSSFESRAGVTEDTLARLDEVQFGSDRQNIAQKREHAIEIIKSKVTEREFAVIGMRLGFNGQTPRTLIEVGTYLGVSAERVRQIYNAALDKARDVIKFRPSDLDI